MRQRCVDRCPEQQRKTPWKSPVLIVIEIHSFCTRKIKVCNKKKYPQILIKFILSPSFNLTGEINFLVSEAFISTLVNVKEKEIFFSFLDNCLKC